MNFVLQVTRDESLKISPLHLLSHLVIPTWIVANLALDAAHVKATNPGPTDLRTNIRRFRVLKLNNGFLV